MTLNNVKPRTAMMRFSRSTVSTTALLLGLVMTEDCALSNIRIPLEGKPDPRNRLLGYLLRKTQYFTQSREGGTVRRVDGPDIMSSIAKGAERPAQPRRACGVE